jgi:thiol-disulfide isomerase/thioredoxin
VYLQQPAQEQPNAPSLPDAAYSQHPQPPEAPARTIPEQLPDISLADREGVRRKLSEWKGRPLVVNFWATWCDPCRREIPLLKSLRRERSAEGIEVIGIAVDFRDAVIRYAHEIGIDYPLLIGEQDALDAIAAFGMDTVFPFTVFADRQGRIVTLKVGELHPDEAHFILDRLRDLDQGRLELAAARQQIAAGIRRLAQERAQAGSPAPPQGT